MPRANGRKVSEVKRATRRAPLACKYRVAGGHAADADATSLPQPQQVGLPSWGQHMNMVEILRGAVAMVAMVALGWRSKLKQHNRFSSCCDNKPLN